MKYLWLINATVTLLCGLVLFSQPAPEPAYWRLEYMARSFVFVAAIGPLWVCFFAGKFTK